MALADGERGNVIRKRAIQKWHGTWAADDELPHVRNVKDANGRAHRLVLIDDAGVLHRHFPPGKWHHSGAKFEMHVVEWGAAERFVSHSMNLAVRPRLSNRPNEPNWPRP